MTAHSAFPKPDDFHAIGVRVMCNDHDLFVVRTLDDARDAVQYLKALCAVTTKEATTMPDTPDVDALVEGILRDYRAGCWLDERALATLADLARKATTPPVEGYDWRKDWRLGGPRNWFHGSVADALAAHDRVAAYIEQQQAALTAANARAEAFALRNEELQRMVDAGLERSSTAAREAVK